MPGQVVPEDVPVFTKQDGSGTAFVAGRRVIVGPNTNRILRVLNLETSVQISSFRVLSIHLSLASLSQAHM
jgi:hypothetical protein